MKFLWSHPGPCGSQCTRSDARMRASAINQSIGPIHLVFELHKVASIETSHTLQKSSASSCAPGYMVLPWKFFYTPLLLTSNTSQRKFIFINSLFDFSLSFSCFYFSLYFLDLSVQPFMLLVSNLGFVANSHFFI